MNFLTEIHVSPEMIPNDFGDPNFSSSVPWGF